VQNSSGNGKRTYRRHEVNLKRQLASLCCEPGASVAAIAREHGINANMLFMWRKQYALGTSVHSAVLLPVQVRADGGQTDVTQTVARSSPRTLKCDLSGPLIEIEMSGVLLRLHGTIDEGSLCSVLRAVRGST
jgi:transposase